MAITKTTTAKGLAVPIILIPALLFFPIRKTNAPGDKVSFWRTSGLHYGIATQSNPLQIHTAISAPDIVFGISSSSSLLRACELKEQAMQESPPMQMN